MEKKVKYRLEINYLSKDRDDAAVETSSPIYTLDEGMTEYVKALSEKCVDDKRKPARVHLWEYAYKGRKLTPITIAKNY